MRTAIVTGASGFIGSVFVEQLVQNGISVLALGRTTKDKLSPRKQKQLSAAEYLSFEMADLLALPNKISEIKWQVGEDCVFFNLAWSGVEKLSDLDVGAQFENVSHSNLAMEVANVLCCKRFIQAGTMEEAFTEKYYNLDHNLNTEYNRHLIYSVAKMAAKYALTLKAEELGIEFIYVLHSHVMGPEDDKDSFLQVTLEKIVNGEPLIFSSGDQYFDVISVEDCANGYLLICEKGRPGEVYWVGSGEPLKLKEYVKKMYKLFPSNEELQFGKLPYNDVVLSPDDFSIDKLVLHTGFKNSIGFDEIVKKLYESLFSKEI
ncbi:NAD(P)-dependent oxidoreductase [Alphaproteobacteria bacterium]|nr:NAD(P)-dependent oxidoreductase [Alphaproteobacteria bacterium]